MKQKIAMILTMLVALALVGCGGTPGETTLPPQTTTPTEQTETMPIETAVPPTTTPPETTLPQEVGDGMVELAPLLEGSDIEMTVEGETIYLSEDGLTVELRTNSRFGKRKDHYISTLKAEPQIIDGKVYVHEFYYKNVLLARTEEVPSLFYGMWFFAEEVEAALKDPEGSVFNQKLLDEILLPASMGIEIPRITAGRIFQEVTLSELSKAFLEELEGTEFADRGDLTYTEYGILSGEQTLVQRQRYEGWESAETTASEEQKIFLQEKGVEPHDVWYLYKWFYNGYQTHSEEELKAALEECYRADLMLSGIEWEG